MESTFHIVCDVSWKLHDKNWASALVQQRFLHLFDQDAGKHEW